MRESMMTSEKCPECGSVNIGDSSHNGEVMCKNCGLILDSNPIEKEPYISEAKKNHVNLFFGSGTKPTHGKIYKASWMESTRQKNLKAGMRTIDRLASKLHLPPSATKESKSIFKRAIDRDLGIGRINRIKILI